MVRRLKLVFSDPGAFAASLAIEAAPILVRSENVNRLALSVELTGRAFDRRGRLIGFPADVRISEEAQYDLENEVDFDLFADVEGPSPLKEADMVAVLDRINAREAWTRTRGAGVLIAVIDTGINGKRREFAPARRAGAYAPPGVDLWRDDRGHGTMCAAIAAASRAEGGEMDGVAPEADLMSCCTSFGEVELSAIYDELRALRTSGRAIVATNSWGTRTGTPPPPPLPDNLFVEAMSEAIAAGVHVVFSAGNYHGLAGGAADACHPNSVWLHKDRKDVLTVASCDLDDRMWSYSSRGPGQHPGDPRASSKPDVTGPTPRNGEVLYGDELRVLPDGWGTSGAAPQAAGLAALLLSLDPGLNSDTLYAHIRDAAHDLGFDRNCQGAGRLNCTAALDRISR